AAGQLAAFYRDLSDPDFETALAVIHQRYSTNTFPNWFLAQPFRLLAHNGEINTIEGNRNWMRAREADLRSKAWGRRVANLKPVIWNKGSDSAGLDDALELLSRSGRDVLHSMMMLIPEAHENSPHNNPAVRGFYDYAACLMEAWDGPASVAFSDGRIVGAALDRNGLRPARYAITSDGRFIMASEAGTVAIDPEMIIHKGRLGPGKMIAVDTELGLLLDDDRIKTERAANLPYAEWVRRSMIVCPTDPKKKAGERFGKDEGGRMKDEKRSYRGDSSFIPHPSSFQGPLAPESLTRRMKSFGYTLEDVKRIIEPMIAEAVVPVGSMGDDTPLAALSAKPRLLYCYFKQRFAQITNPAIDPIRERTVMSLETLLGARGSLLEETADHARLIKLHSPVLTDAQLKWLREIKDRRFRTATLAATFDPEQGERGLKLALEALCKQSVEAIERGCHVLILSDRPEEKPSLTVGLLNESLAPVPMLLAVGAVHHHLCREGKRMRVGLVAETGEAREDHHFACLIGYGANAVNPYLAFEVVADVARKRGEDTANAIRNYEKAIESGLLKIMAKMGIATIASYCGSQVFEAIGLDRALVEEYFTGTPSRLCGIGLREIAEDALRFRRAAFSSPTVREGFSFEDAGLEDAGFYRYRAGGEYHSFNPDIFRSLHKLARSGDRSEYDRYAEQIAARWPTTLRDLLDFRAGTPIGLDEVEPVENILSRMSTSGMSFGALSREAHETLAIAMNRMGAKSNSGEGGEDPARYHPRAQGKRKKEKGKSLLEMMNDERGTPVNHIIIHTSSFESRTLEEERRTTDNGQRTSSGDSANSRIKQVASARFGVTPEYLMSADEIEIKISQGSKPGEGGQLPGHKVSAEIAAVRHSVEGVALISPPPHHDIYSIEDLAQLIYDLKQINPRARVAVKLVSVAGVGTVAAGVAKAYADTIHISGHDGGTGASPLGSIKNAGTPWEIGLAETQQVLVMNDLRGRVRLRVDGGLKSGRDVVIAAMLGAEEFGFATSAIVALGCVMARQCHLNTCPVGIATQSPHLRQKFAGTPEMVISFFRSLAEDVRHILADLGFRSLEELCGRSDLLIERSGLQLPRGASLDLSPVLRSGVSGKDEGFGEKDEKEASSFHPSSFIPHPSNSPASLHPRFLRDASEAIANSKSVSLAYEINNTNRSVGARVAGEIARCYEDAGLPDATLDITFRGSAGQSFGAFNLPGMKLTLYGEANDYVGKGMAGGEIIIRPPDESGFDWSENVIMGNTVMYGATGGTLFAAGRAGERFCVRNSGGRAVVEGLGDHGCEYMTAGQVVVLGEVGRNFAAGMTGGVAFVLDSARTFEKNCNQELVTLEAVSSNTDVRILRSLILRHYELTGSPRAREVIWRWARYRSLFWKVVTQGARAALSQERSGQWPSVSDQWSVALSSRL
ncbi:MAG: glutamate synthase-related protein, partial [Blastocatellia bacterium]|nr:glutamate synthase-related protein [Blastocatellia bacterium]